MEGDFELVPEKLFIGGRQSEQMFLTSKGVSVVKKKGMTFTPFDQESKLISIFQFFLTQI